MSEGEVICMSVKDAKCKLEQMQKQYEIYKDSIDPAGKEYANYLSVKIDLFEKTITEFENREV